MTTCQGRAKLTSKGGGQNADAEHAARSTQHAARSTQHAARSTLLLIALSGSVAACGEAGELDLGRVQDGVVEACAGPPVLTTRHTFENINRAVVIQTCSSSTGASHFAVTDEATGLPADFAGPAIDLGTGAGSLAVTLALEFSRLTVVAADISLGALRVARKNAVKHGVSQRLPLLCGDWLSALAARPCFRLIVANPPYVDSGYAPIMHPEVRDFEPHVALFGGAGGLVQIRRLLPQVARRLMPQGLYMQEFAAGHGDEVLELARQAGLTRCEVLPDFAGIERTLVASIN